MNLWVISAEKNKENVFMRKHGDHSLNLSLDDSDMNNKGKTNDNDMEFNKEYPHNLIHNPQSTPDFNMLFTLKDTQKNSLQGIQNEDIEFDKVSTSSSTNSKIPSIQMSLWSNIKNNFTNKSNNTFISEVPPIIKQEMNENKSQHPVIKSHQLKNLWKNFMENPVIKFIGHVLFYTIAAFFLLCTFIGMYQIFIIFKQ